MEQRFGLARTTPARAARFTLHYRWMRFFFTEASAPGVLNVIDLQRRAVWIALAICCQSLVLIVPTFTPGQNNDTKWYIVLLALAAALIPCGLTLGGFFALWMAIKPATLPQKLEFARQHGARWQRMTLLRTLVLLVIGGVLLAISVIQWFLPPAYSNDGTSLDTNAAQLLLEGKNPYTSSNILDIAHRFDIQPGWTTPLRQGQFAGRLDYPSSVEVRSAFDTALKANDAPEFESRVSYPALSFLSLVPLVFLKIYNVLPFYLLSYLLLAWIAWKVARQELRPWVLLLALANVPMLSSAMSGSLDILYMLLLVLAWLLREKRWLSALFFGLALASKQLAWFFVPFYLVMIWRQQSLREASLRLILAGALALLINLPFICWNPAAWLAGVLAPMADPMFPMGVGLINLSSYHLLPYLPSWCYLTLEAGAMAGVLVYYWRICRVCPEAAMLLAVLPLFLAWRSLPSYFSCTAFPILLLMVARSKTSGPARTLQTMAS
ncbi:MAG TPA: glycosyltransferase 87 family protein [Ktedonobacteraceae bacterium]|nr:glycosyltransferase 87 family protein [Ktedonobacteraceae bacterium]